MEAVSLELLTFLMLTALLAGFIDSIAGGGGLLVLPVLLSTGMPPAQALATNKLQGTFGTLSATLTFLQKGHLKLGGMWLAILMTVIGAAIGAWLAQVIEPSLLSQLIPILLIAIVLYYILSPKISADTESDGKFSNNAFSVSVAPTVGFYDGFFGPGAGAFYTTSYVIFRGYKLLTATAHTKVLNFISNLASLVVFIVGGQVFWKIGLIMGVAQLVGAYLGSRLVIHKGAGLVRPMLIVTSLLITMKLVISDESHFIHQFLLSIVKQ